MPAVVQSVDERNKVSFFSGLWEGGKKGLESALNRTPLDVANTSTTEQVGAGIFDILYTRVKSGSREGMAKAAEKFRGSRRGQEFITETKKQELEAMIKNPWTWAIVAFAIVAFVVVRGK